MRFLLDLSCVFAIALNANYIAAFFALLAVIFLILSSTGTASLARKIQRRIGIIFAAVAVVIFIVHPR